MFSILLRVINLSSTYNTIIKIVSFEYVLYKVDQKTFPGIECNIKICQTSVTMIVQITSGHRETLSADIHVTPSLLAHSHSTVGSTDHSPARHSGTLFWCQVTALTSHVLPGEPPWEVQLYTLTRESKPLRSRLLLLACIVFRQTGPEIEKRCYRRWIWVQKSSRLVFTSTLEREALIFKPCGFMITVVRHPFPPLICVCADCTAFTSEEVYLVSRLCSACDHYFWIKSIAWRWSVNSMSIRTMQVWIERECI